jgi:hypothetical protein
MAIFMSLAEAAAEAAANRSKNQIHCDAITKRRHALTEKNSLSNLQFATLRDIHLKHIM